MKISAKLQKTVTERAKQICEYCRMRADFSHDPFEIEHINPISNKGKTEEENLAFACRGCNLYKSDKIEAFDDVNEETVRLFNPRKDFWNEHFAWPKNYTIVVGLTPIGRATGGA